MKPMSNSKLFSFIALAALSFVRAGEWLFAPLGANWAYTLDQFVLPIVAVSFALSWLRGGKDREIDRSQALGWGVPLALTIFIGIASIASFHRVFYDEYANVMYPMKLLAERNQFEALSGSFFLQWREVYGWGPFTLLYNLFGWSAPLFAAVAVGFKIGGAIALAWLTNIVSKNKIAALIAGLLIGINPNTFAELPWLSNVMADNFGLILMCLTVGTWIIARRNQSKYGILLSLLLMAATLKSGGVVRTISVAGVVVAYDIIFHWIRMFGNLVFDKSWIKSWLIALGMTVGFAVLNPGIMGRPSKHIPLDVGLAQLAEATTRMFVPPTKLDGFLAQLHTVSDRGWIVPVGVVIFVIGTILAITLPRTPYRAFTWGWVWLYGTLFYTAWTADFAATKMSDLVDKSDLLFAGHKYAYIPLAGFYMGAAIAISKAVLTKRTVTTVGFLTTLVFAGLFGLYVGSRITEFGKLDRMWYQERTIRDTAGIEALKEITAHSSVQEPAVVLARGKHNPLVRNEAGRYSNDALSPTGSVYMFAETEEDQFTNAWQVIPGAQRFIYTWNEEEKRMEVTR